ncbi:MAG: DNA internalization-related competence protein ComEC/Rec2 [Gammaproteobacteria bacterium]|nr:DNA internalization-related competence protein ComEC/Rec2 [Gammaproteobacteria bacterium]
MTLYLLVVSILSCCSRSIRPLGFTGLGCCWALLHGHMGLDNRIPISWQGKDIWVAGEIAELPRIGERSQRFVLETDAIRNCSDLPIVNAAKSACTNRYRLLLNYYHAETIRPGERWLFKVKLNRPRAQANRGAFDYEAWLFRKRISATGYVKSDVNNRQLANSEWRQFIHQVRFRIKNRVAEILGESPRVGLLTALIIGESNMIAATDWNILSATGTNHLLIISGLHVSLVAGLIYRLLLLIARLRYSGSTAVRLAAVTAAVAAAGYAALAGFGLPVQRALIMVLVVFMGLASGRKISVRSSFCLALFGVVAVDPLASFTPGFWLSFGAVFVLLYTFVGRYRMHYGWSRILVDGLKAQWVIFVTMFTITGYLILQVSLVSPLANMIAIPWISILVVPGLLLSTLSLLVSNDLAVFLYHINDQLLGLLFQYLTWLAELKWIWYAQSLGVLAAILGFAAGLIVLLPRGMPGRWLGVVLMLPALQPVITRPLTGELNVTVLDVGQGLSIVLQTRNHAMVYDMGARYSDRFDFGSAVVIPALRVRGIKRLDKVIISNGDVDHAGGARSVVQMLQPSEVSSGNPDRVSGMLQLDRHISNCRRGERWFWDGVWFEILHPGVDSDTATRWQGNNRSCVLLISVGQSRILLPGDIEKEVEKELVASGISNVELLVVPHHGSRTSSTPLFLNTLQPGYAIVSAGYMNRFQHPDDLVVNRYLHRGVRLLNTATEGEIDIKITPSEPLKISSYRRDNPHYWTE